MRLLLFRYIGILFDFWIDSPAFLTCKKCGKYVLFYLLQMPTFQVLGMLFGVSKTEANDTFHYWILILNAFASKIVLSITPQGFNSSHHFKISERAVKGATSADEKLETKSSIDLAQKTYWTFVTCLKLKRKAILTRVCFFRYFYGKNQNQLNFNNYNLI